jgi:hypothetical protein
MAFATPFLFAQKDLRRLTEPNKSSTSSEKLMQVSEFQPLMSHSSPMGGREVSRLLTVQGFSS